MVMVVPIGRGLEALIGQDPQPEPSHQDRTKRLSELNRRLEELDKEVQERMKELEDVRKDMTIQLMLEGKVDRTRINSAEEGLRQKKEEREMVRRELDSLRKGAPNLNGQGLGPEKGAVQNGADAVYGPSSELDMRIIKAQDKEAEQAAGPSYLNRLKQELSPLREAQRIRMEARKEIPPEIMKPQVDLTSPQGAQGPPVVQSPAAEDRKVSPKRVRVVREQPKVAEAVKDKRMYELIDKAVSLIEANDPRPARDLLLEGLRDYPMDDEILYHLGNAYVMLGELDAAEIRFRKSIERNSRAYWAYNNLGAVMRRKGKNEAAIRLFNQALEVNYMYERAWFNLGSLFMEIDPPLLKEAEIFLRRALDCDPKFEKARTKLRELEELRKTLSSS